LRSTRQSDERGSVGRWRYFNYDSLSRLTSAQNLESGTVKYSYDAQGDLTSVANGNSTTNYTSFDVMGNVLASSQVTQGQTYSFSYNYNVAGALTSETYPS